MHLSIRPSRRVLACAGVLVVAVGGGSAYWLCRPGAAAAQAATMTVSTQTFKTTVSASGTVEPANQADLTFGASGTVTAVLVKAGDKVAKGDVLARIDSTLLASQVTAKASSLDAAQTRLTEDEDADADSTQLASDRAQVVNAETELESAKQDLADAALRATTTGTVAAVTISKGDTVGSGGTATGTDSTSSADVTVVSTGRFVVSADVAAADIAQVKRGLQVEVTPTGATDPVYGTVGEVGKVATASSAGAATFAVTVDLTGRQKDIYAGSSATVSIIVKQVDDVLAVPSMALHQDGNTTYVYKLVDAKRVKTTVTTGTTYGVETQVKSGLKDGDVVEIISFTRTPGSGGGNEGPIGQFGGPGGLGGAPTGGTFNGGTGGAP